MAQKRMFSLQVIDTDKFMDMSASAQALYFHLGMHGDDDGFVASPRKIARAAGCNDDDLRLLASKGYIIPFESEVIVITDWRLNNTLKNDRYHETLYAVEKSQLTMDSAGRYSLGNIVEPYRNQTAPIPEPELNITELNETKQSIAGGSKADKPPTRPKAKPERKQYGQYGWVKLSQEEYSRLSNDLGENEVKRCIAYLDESAQSTGNKNKWRDWNLVIRRCSRDRWGLKDAAAGRNALKTAADYDRGEDFFSC